MSTIDLLGLDAEPVTDEPDAVHAARLFLDGNGLAGTLTPPVADALVEVLLRRGDGEKLGVLASLRSDKELSKKARRAIHVLRTRGVSVEVPHGASATFAPEQVEEIPSLCSATDNWGDSVVYCAATDPERGVEIFECLVHQVRGLTGFQNYGMSRRRWREAMSDWENETRMTVARVPGAFARWLIEEAFERAVASGRTPLRSFQEARRRLPPLVVPSRHPVLELVSDEEIAKAGSEVELVLDVPDCLVWTPEQEWCERFEAQLQEIMYSPLNVDERMRDRRIEERMKATVAEALSAGWRERIERRFLDTGYLILRRGGSKRMHDVARCVAAARYMADPSVPLDENRLALQLFARLLPESLSDAKPRAPSRTSSGLILPP